MRWMIYGANGYTGRLLAEEAVRRGHTPTLAGRSRDAVAEIARSLDLPHRVFPLDHGQQLRTAIEDQDLVLHAAGPFVRTAAPMIAACLDTKTHYVDVTGEIPVFQHTFACDGAARQAGIVLISGGGFDVVPSDCLLRHVVDRLPDATALELDIAGGTNRSPGTTLSVLDMLPRGGLVRRGGELVPFPLGQGARRVAFADRERTVVPIPWGDLETAWHSTGVGDITVSMDLGPGADRLLRWTGPLLQRVLSHEGLRARIGKVMAGTSPGPTAEERRTGRCEFRARATSGRGEEAISFLETPEAYQLTVLTALRLVEKILETSPVGALTPSQAFGADWILEIPGVRRIDV